MPDKTTTAPLTQIIQPLLPLTRSGRLTASEPPQIAGMGLSGAGWINPRSLGTPRKVRTFNLLTNHPVGLWVDDNLSWLECDLLNSRLYVIPDAICCCLFTVSGLAYTGNAYQALRLISVDDYEYLAALVGDDARNHGTRRHYELMDCRCAKCRNWRNWHGSGSNQVGVTNDEFKRNAKRARNKEDYLKRKADKVN